MKNIGKKFSLWTKYGALNSHPVFEAFAQGAARLGHTCRENITVSDVDVIWSVLWRGRMQGNQSIFNRAKQKNKPVIVLEVGALNRGKTWKMAVNGITNDCFYGLSDIDNTRRKKLSLQEKPWKKQDGAILLTGQHRQSQQWDTPQHMDFWLKDTVTKIRQNTDRKIILRPHPRCPISMDNFRHIKHISYQRPNRLSNTYDDYDLDFKDVSCLVNYSSNPGIISAIAGIPIFVSNKSLAWPVSNTEYNTIENPIMPDRTDWLNKISYTEWTLEEISTGYPLSRLTSAL